MRYFVRYQFGGGKQPKHCITVEANNVPHAYKAARLMLPNHVINSTDFHFYDCVRLVHEKALSQTIYKSEPDMDIVTFEKSAWDELNKRVQSLVTRFNEKEKPHDQVWLTNEELEKLLKISKRTTQLYRDNGMIPYSQVGNKIYYKLSDIEHFLESHLTKATI